MLTTSSSAATGVVTRSTNPARRLLAGWARSVATTDVSTRGRKITTSSPARNR